MAESYGTKWTWTRLLLAGGVTAGLSMSTAHPYYSANAFAPHGRLIRMETLASADAGQVCVMPAAMQRSSRVAAMQPGGSRLPGGETLLFVNDPIRNVRDKYPAFAAIAVDPERNEVIVTDENLFQVLAYNRLENTHSDREASKPKRILSGDNTLIEFQSGLYVDQKNGDVYAPNNDTVDTLVVFSHGAQGDVKPKRALHTPHGTFGIAVDEKRNELFLTTQHDATVVVFRKDADKDEGPIRLLQGDDTGLADPHGIAIDPKEEVFFVANYGSRASRRADLEPQSVRAAGSAGLVKENWPIGREYAVPGSGSHSEPSITVHRLSAAGNDRPLRKIQGPKTQLNWPTGIAFDPERRELFVANDMGPSIVVFDANASGDVAPKRVLKGPETKLANPTGVALDLKHGELWVANFGGHSATAYSITSQGNTAPLRTIRSAPESAPSLMIGNPGALTYDRNREEILVPN